MITIGIILFCCLGAYFLSLLIGIFYPHRIVAVIMAVTGGIFILGLLLGFAAVCIHDLAGIL